MGVFRFFHSTSFYQSVNKSALAVLRKKTGFSIANIRKALDINNNDPAKAEEWLMEQAKALGWNKVMKVQNRQASQGLVAVALKNKKVAMVEVNCETDFVARNEKFRSFVESVTRTCLHIPVLSSGETTNKVNINAEEVSNLKVNNTTLADQMALLIGSVGENLVLKRAFCYETTENDVEVAVAVHPPVENSEILLGKYGTFLSYQKNSDLPSTENSETVIDGLCKHIIGMNPVKIGVYENHKSKGTDEEKILIHQEYVLDDSITVGELLKESGIKLLDFKRFECGETISEETLSSPNQCDEKEVNATSG